MKQWEMAALNDDRVRFIIGDVRDRERLYRALDNMISLFTQQTLFQPQNMTHSNVLRQMCLGR